MASRLLHLFVAPTACDRHNNINFIRFVAASAVIYGHMAHIMGVPGPMLCGQSIASLAVKIFFAVSGFLITQSFLRDGHPFRYLIRRIFRIFPGLIFVVLVTTFLFGPLVSILSPSEYLTHPATWDYLYNCILNPRYALPGVFAAAPYPDVMNGSLWTLPVEFSLYLLLPLLLVPLRALNIEKVGILVLAVGCSVLDLCNMAGIIDLSHIVWGTRVGDAMVLVPYFFFGALAVYPEVRSKFNLQLSIALLIMLVAVHTSVDWKYEIFVLLVLPYVTLSWALATPAVFGRVFAVNDYSYGIYLWAFPIQQMLVYGLGPQAMGLMAYSVLAFCCTLPCAMVSWFLVEQPCSRLGKRLTTWSRVREKASRTAESTVESGKKNR